jgi:hypothetical protein
MGQFTEQVQQITAAQNEILTERKRKQKAKEQKELLKYLIDKYKLRIIETIEPLRDEPYNNILYNDILIKIFNDFEKELKKYSYFDKITIQLKVKELESFTYKEITRQKSRYKKIELEEAATQKQQEKQQKELQRQQEKATKEHLQQCEKEIYLLFERTYKKYGHIAYNKLNNCKYEILEYLYGNNYTYKNIAFYERLNKQFSKQYPQKQKVNYFSAVCLGLLYGRYKGLKNTNKRR